MFYIDEDLDGPAFTNVLATASVPIVRHRDLFPKGEADTSWVPEVSRRGLIILSANTGMLMKTLEIQAIRVSGAQVLYLHQGRGSKHGDLAELLIRSRSPIATFFAAGVRPRVGVLKRQPHSKDPVGVRAGYIDVPKRFR